jgi:hypothetical protein
MVAILKDVVFLILGKVVDQLVKVIITHRMLPLMQASGEILRKLRNHHKSHIKMITLVMKV